MKKTAAALAALAGLILGVGGLSPADAGTVTNSVGTLTALDASAFKDQCVNEKQQLTSPYSPSYDATVTGPGGVSESVSFDGGGAGTVELCTFSDPAGTYTEHVPLYDDDDNYVGALDVTFRLSLHKPSLKVKLRHEVYRGMRAWLLTGALSVDGKPWKHRVVRIQAHIDGLWFTVPGARLKTRTDNKGQVSHIVLPSHSIFRLYVSSTAKTPEVVSKPFTAPPYH